MCNPDNVKSDAPAAPLKLEVGKVYRDRCGLLMRVTKEIGWSRGDDGQWLEFEVEAAADGVYPTGWKIAKGTQNGYRREDGRYTFVANSLYDLVEEVSIAIPDIQHADLIRAVLDGKTLQVTDERGVPKKDWSTFSGPSALRMLIDYPDRYYRVKPDSTVRYMAVFVNGDLGPPRASKDLAFSAANKTWGDGLAKVLRIELDPDTLDVVSAKTEDA
jgi:hypothetical protein